MNRNSDGASTLDINWINDINYHFVELKPSTVCSGVGVFAIKDIPEGTNVFYNGKKDSYYYWPKDIDPAVRSLIEKLCHTNYTGFMISDHPVNLGMSYYVNHSDDPNVKYNKKTDTFTAIKHIGAGTELLVKYPKREQDWLT